MSFLRDYEQRTAWKYEPVRGRFHTAEGLTRKVGPDGRYLPFPGSTVVFRTGKREQHAIELIQEWLRRLLEGTDMLAAPLPASTAHMTLHDLVSPEQCASDPADEGRFLQETAASLEKAAAIVERIRSEYAGRTIALTADRIVNMVSKSLVLMLKPRTETDFELLTDLYHRFDEVVSLPYPLTPHITLAYFRPGMLDGDRLWEAMEAAQVRGDEPMVFEFDVESLTAQYFSDMQRYEDVPRRVCLCCDGGLNRSVLAANILNREAARHGLPIRAQARAAGRSTQGRPVPQGILNVLREHGAGPDETGLFARPLEDREFSHFTDFAAITPGALDRFDWMRIPESRIRGASAFFYGVRDPEYGEITCEQAFEELSDRAARYLDSLNGSAP